MGQALELPRSYAEVIPDLVVENKSSTDSLPPLNAKLASLLDLGVSVGILVDPDRKTITLYQAGADPLQLENGDSLTRPYFLGESKVEDLWPPMFED